jgi:hypothetical protein
LLLGVVVNERSEAAKNAKRSLLTKEALPPPEGSLLTKEALPPPEGSLLTKFE